MTFVGNRRRPTWDWFHFHIDLCRQIVRGRLDPLGRNFDCQEMREIKRISSKELEIGRKIREHNLTFGKSVSLPTFEYFRGFSIVGFQFSTTFLRCLSTILKFDFSINIETQLFSFYCWKVKNESDPLSRFYHRGTLYIIVGSVLPGKMYFFRER